MNIVVFHCLHHMYDIFVSFRDALDISIIAFNFPLPLLRSFHLVQKPGTVEPGGPKWDLPGSTVPWDSCSGTWRMVLIYTTGTFRCGKAGHYANPPV